MAPDDGAHPVLDHRQQVRLAQLARDEHDPLVPAAQQAPQLGRGGLVDPVREQHGDGGVVRLLGARSRPSSPRSGRTSRDGWCRKWLISPARLSGSDAWTVTVTRLVSTSATRSFSRAPAVRAWSGARYGRRGGRAGAPGPVSGTH
ncbi:hypothetical protein GTY86_34395, partial [Streptomyces sp. SID5770]|uniref:hypothetical protein n=1 Tax=Streptomyces sp. SID5770 TaxID=2690308 RepID=UPI001369FD7B